MAELSLAAGSNVDSSGDSDAESSSYPSTSLHRKHLTLEIAQSEQDVSPFCKESDMTYS